MSRIRSIKPEFWSSEQIMECSTNARLLFIGLWNFCDDAGRHPHTPKQIKALVFPGDDFTPADIARMLDELSTNGLLRIYTVDGKDYFQITGWSHQKIDRPQSPKYPGPIDEHSPSPRDGRDEGGDGKGKDTEAKASGASAPSTVVPIDARTALWRDGIDKLRRMTGKPEDATKKLLGQWLKANGDDARSLLGVIERAFDLQPADPVAWITKANRPKPSADDPMRNVL